MNNHSNTNKKQLHLEVRYNRHSCWGQLLHDGGCHKYKLNAWDCDKLLLHTEGNQSYSAYMAIGTLTLQSNCTILNDGCRNYKLHSWDGDLLWHNYEAKKQHRGRAVIITLHTLPLAFSLITTTAQEWISQWRKAVVSCIHYSWHSHLEWIAQQVKHLRMWFTVWQCLCKHIGICTYSTILSVSSLHHFGIFVSALHSSFPPPTPTPFCILRWFVIHCCMTDNKNKLSLLHHSPSLSWTHTHTHSTHTDISQVAITSVILHFQDQKRMLNAIATQQAATHGLFLSPDDRENPS